MALKKLVFTFLTLVSLGAVHALPVGNPSESILLADGLLWDGNDLVTFCDYWCNPFISWFDVLTLRGGYYGDFVFNRHLEINRHGHDSIERTKILTNAGYLVLNFFEQFDIFGTLGETKFSLDTNAKVFNSTAGEPLYIDTSSAFSWSVGGRITLLECKCTTVGIEGQFFQTRPNVKLVNEGDVSVYTDEDHIHAKYHEWQVGLGISQRINMLVPYVAMKWSKANLNFDHQHFTTLLGDNFYLFDLVSANLMGFALGVSLADCEKCAVTVEGRFGDERALYVNGQLRF